MWQINIYSSLHFLNFIHNFKIIKVIIIIIIPPSFLWETHYFLLRIPDEINIKTLPLWWTEQSSQPFLVPVAAIRLVSHSQNQLVVNSSRVNCLLYSILWNIKLRWPLPPSLPSSFPPLDFYRQGFFWPQSLFSLLDAFQVENARSTMLFLYFTFYILASVIQAYLLLVIPTSYVFTVFLYWMLNWSVKWIFKRKNKPMRRSCASPVGRCG